MKSFEISGARRFWDQVRALWSGPLTARELSSALVPPAISGVQVNEQTALQLSAVWAAVNYIAGTTASVPLILYRRLPNGGRERYAEHPIYRLLHDEPNPDMSAFQLREVLMSHVLLYGNCYAEIQRDIAGRPIAFWPITPDRVQPDRINGQLIYRVSNGGASAIILPSDMIHVAGLGYDGLQGYSVVSKARESIGLGLASERFGASLFGNGANVGSLLTAPPNINEEKLRDSRETIEKYHRGGPELASKILVLSHGWTFGKMSIPPDDAQFLETRQFQTIEIARWFGLPPYVLGVEGDAKGWSTIEGMQIEATQSLRRWWVRIESELNRKLLSPAERSELFAEHLIDGLLRGDQKSRYEAYAIATSRGWMSTNEVRQLENWNPIDGGDAHLVPLNMLPLDRLDEYADKLVSQPAPASPAAADEPAERALVAAANEARAVAEARQVEAVEARAALEAELATVRSADRQRATAFLSAQRSLWASTATRMVERETERIRRAGQQLEKLRSLIESDFYVGHAALMQRALGDLVRVHLAWTGDMEANAVTVTEQLVIAHCAQSRAELQALVDGDAADLAVSLAALLDRWERERPALLADQMMQEGLERVAHAA